MERSNEGTVSDEPSAEANPGSARHGGPLTSTIKIAMPVLLPDVKDLRDACVARLIDTLSAREGVLSVHVVGAGASSVIDEPVQGVTPSVPSVVPQLCLHYDSDRLTLQGVEAAARAAGASLADKYAHLVVPFKAVGAEDDGRRLESALRTLPGVTAAAVNFAGQVARVEFDRYIVNRSGIEAHMRSVGVEPLAATGAANEGPLTETVSLPGTTPLGPPVRSESWYARNTEFAWSMICGALLAGGWAMKRFSGAPPAFSIVLFGLAYFFGARDNVRHFLADVRQGKVHFNIDLLMVLAAIGAASIGAWFEGALLLFLFSLGHALEHYALGRARKAIASLAELAPQLAIVIRNGSERVVPISDVLVGDRVVIKPAERVPVDGVVREGRSAMNQAPITGESVPVDKAPGEPVFAGSVNGDGAVVVEVTAAIGDRTLDRVIALVAEAQTQKAPTQRFTDRFERIFVPLVLVADVVLIVVPPLLNIWSFEDAFYRAMALLVAASPCALAIGTPAAVLSGIAQAARNGVLIKGGAYLEALGGIQLLAVDKTGTITMGEPSVTDVRPMQGVSSETLLATAAALERRSQHPLAKAIVNEASRLGLTVPVAGDLVSITGRGVRSTIDQTDVDVGRLLMFEERGTKIPDVVRSYVAELEKNGRSTVVVRQLPSSTSGNGTDAAEGGWLGVIGLADQPRANAKDTLNDLRRIGIRRIVMLTGDNVGVARAIGDAVGVDEVRAGLLPEDKVTAIKELARTGPVAMIGDGVNDAPALAHATVGIAMGGAGTATALETADVALMGDDLGRLPFAIGLSRKARRIIKQNLMLSLTTIGILIVATTTGLIGIGPAVVLHEGSTLVVVGNALRLLRFRGNH
jgi:Cd2+/Zn2+-exporting ATPase